MTSRLVAASILGLAGWAVGLLAVMGYAVRKAQVARRRIKTPRVQRAERQEWPEDSLRNGAFMGGGAKGIAYIGAIEAVYERGLRFASVAGSSAGAITASFIAAGFTPEEMREVAPVALTTLNSRPFVGFLPWVGKSFFSTRRLRRFIDELLYYRVHGRRMSRRSKSVSFKSLFDVTGIELNIVTMDLARHQPLVFNATTAPGCPVADAVIASSAIPIVMPAVRVLVRTGEDKKEIHRLVDGGAWANYPGFVYSDESFRRTHRLDDPNNQNAPTPSLGSPPRQVLGFVLSENNQAFKPDKPQRLLRGMSSPFDQGTGAREGVLGTFLDWTFLRVTLAIVVPGILSWALIDWLRTQSAEAFPAVASLPPRWQAISVGLLTLLVIIGLTATATAIVVTVRFSAELFSVGYPAVLSTLSVGPGVPGWFGSGDRIVRLSNPLGLKSTKFHIRPPVQEMAINLAHFEAARALNKIEPDRSRRLPPKPDINSVTTRGIRGGRSKGPSMPRLAAGAAIAFCGALGLGTLLALIHAFGERRWMSSAGITLMSAALLALAFLCAGLARRRTLDATPGDLSWPRVATKTVLALGAFVWVTTQLSSTSSLADYAAGRRVSGVVREVISPVEGNADYKIRTEIPLPLGGNAHEYCAINRRCIEVSAFTPNLREGDAVDLRYYAATRESHLASDALYDKQIDHVLVPAGVWVLSLIVLAWQVGDVYRAIFFRRRLDAWA